MTITFVEDATFEIKSGVVFGTFQSADETVKLVFPIVDFRRMMKGAQTALNDFDLDVRVANIAGARAIAHRKGGR